MADNKIALNSEWDEEMLREELEDLATKLESIPGFDLEDFGKEVEAVDFSDKIIPKMAIVIEIETEQEQKKLYEEFSTRGIKCRLLSL